MKRITNYALLITIIGFLISPAYAGSGASSGAEFLKLGGGARALAMGDAYTGFSDDSSALFYNPAGLGQLNFPEVLTMYNKYYLDVNQEIAGFAYPTQFGVIGGLYSGLNSGDIQGYDQNGAATSNFNTGSSVFNLAFSKKVYPNLFAGLGIKSISDKLESVGASTMAFDAGLLYHVNPNFSIGASALNFGPGLKYISDVAPLPSTYRIGAGFLSKIFGDNVTFNSDLVLYPDSTRLNLGAEYLLRNILAFRLGSNGLLRAGLGVYAGMFAFDYAYLSQEDLGSAHQFSLSILFGTSDKVKKQFNDSMDKGKAYLKQGQSALAVESFDKALSLDPRNEEAQILLRRAQADTERGLYESEIQQLKKETQAILETKPTVTKATAGKAEKKSADEVRGYLGDAMKSIMTGKYDDALDQVNKALARDPKNTQALTLKRKLLIIKKVEKK